MLDKVFLQTRVLISRAKNTYPFLEAELVSSSNVSSFAFKLSTFCIYIRIHALKITVSKKQDAINTARHNIIVTLICVILDQNFLTFAGRKLSRLRSAATAYRLRLYFTVLSRLITAATKMYRSPFSTTVAIGSHFLDSTWFPVSGRNGVFFLSKREIDVLSENTKRGWESIRFENHPFKYGIIRWDVSRLGCIPYFQHFPLAIANWNT